VASIAPRGRIGLSHHIGSLHILLHVGAGVFLRDLMCRDPEDDIPFAKALYNNRDFAETLYNALADDGVIVLQLGEAPYHDSPASQFTKARRREDLINILVDVGFETVHVYEDGNCGFDGSWTYLVAAKDSSNDMRWYRRQAEVEVEIHSRIRRTISGALALKYFDGSIMQSYQVPHKVFEVVFCRSEPKPPSCVTDVSRINVPISDFEVKMSGVRDGSGRGVYTKVDIKQGSAIAKKENARPVHVPASSLNLVHKYMDTSADLTKAYGYIDGYGWETETYVSSTVSLPLLQIQNLFPLARNSIVLILLLVTMPCGFVAS
jgi:Spermidine synthase